MTIIVVTNNFFPHRGGVVSSIVTLTEELRAQGHRVIIITLDFGYSITYPDVIQIFCPIKFSYYDKPMAAPVGVTFQLSCIFKTLQPDIIHVHHPFLLGKVAADCGRRLGIPVVFTYHTLYEHYLHYIPVRIPYLDYFTLFYVRLFCRSVDYLIAPSSMVLERCHDTKVPSMIIPSAVEKKFVVPRVEKKLFSQQPLRLVTVSRFAKEKNIPWLLTAFSRFYQKNPDCTFTLYGYGSELESLQSYAYSFLQLPKTIVQFIENPSKDELITAYRAADVFVYASQSETQGIVLAEAMSQSTPIIALQGPSIDSIVKDGINGYVVDSYDKFCQRLKDVMHNVLLYHELSQKAHELSHNYYPQVMAQKVFSVYSQIAR